MDDDRAEQSDKTDAIRCDAMRCDLTNGEVTRMIDACTGIRFMRAATDHDRQTDRDSIQAIE
jgi:hypothetical protein